VTEERRNELGRLVLSRSRELGLRLRVAVDRLSGKLVYVGKDRLGKLSDHLFIELGRMAGSREPAPGDARPDPVCGLQRIERPARPQLTAAERDVDLAAVIASPVWIADQADEAIQGLIDARPDGLAESTVQRPRVLRHLLADRGHDLTGDCPELGAQDTGQAGGQLAPWLCRFTHLDEHI
jgi:hypothetical protein